MATRVKHTKQYLGNGIMVEDGYFNPIAPNMFQVVADKPNITDSVKVGSYNKRNHVKNIPSNAQVDNDEIVRFNPNGSIQVITDSLKLGGQSLADRVRQGYPFDLAFAAQERYKDIHHLKDNGDSYKSGGIHIAPSKRGTFTAAAKQHGMGVQAFANKVLANKSNYSPAMVKKANFARNASKWHHALGGETEVKNDYLTIPLQGNPLYDITGETKYKSDNLDNPESRKFILDALWAMENPYEKGLNKDGTYSSYGDPNGEDQDVGPGILLSNLPSKDSYTKQELEDYVYARVLEGRNKIRQSFDAKYGEGEYDKLDDTRKYIMDDVRYRYGTVAQSEWPNLYQAIYDNDIINALINARTTFKNKKGEIIGWDNNRIENLAKYFYPDVVVEHKGNKDTYLKVYKKK